MNKVIRSIMILTVIILFFAFGFIVSNSVAKAQTNQPYHFFNNPYQGNPAHATGTMINNAILWTSPDMKTAWGIYQLNYGDRVVIDYQDTTGKYYLVKWYFESYRRPIIGWTDKNSILLDIDTTPSP